MKIEHFSETRQLSDETNRINFELTKLLDGMSLAEKQALANYIAKLRPKRVETLIDNKEDSNPVETAFSQDTEKNSKIVNIDNYRDKTDREKSKKHDNYPTDDQGVIVGFRTRKEQETDKDIDHFLKTNGLGEQAYNWEKVNEQRRTNINNPNYPCVFWIRWMDLTALYININCQEYVMNPIEALDTFGDNTLFLNELVNLIVSPLDHMYSKEQQLVFKKKVMERR